MLYERTLRVIEVGATVLTACGTFAVSFVAIWGDRIKDYLFGPRVELSLVSTSGDLTTRANGSWVYYFHIRVRNRRKGSIANAVRVFVRSVALKSPGDSFVLEPLVYPLQLQWTPFELGETERNISDAPSTCDFGFLGKSDDAFQITTMVTPNNFRGRVGAGGCGRYEIIATGANVRSSKLLVLEVAWDGKKTEDQNEMRRHLIVKQVGAIQ